MKVIYIKSFEDLKLIEPNINIVLGLFDGLHVGHCQLISTARYLSKGKLAVLSFDGNLKVNDKQVLMAMDDKLEGFERLGADYAYIFRCDEEFKRIDHITFINKILKKFEPIRIFCGPDFKFGFKAQGNIDTLKSRFSNVTVLNYVNDYKGDKISSSDIKNLIREGKLEEAKTSLGHVFHVNGKIVEGLHNGKKIGFPTANLLCKTKYVLPKPGVYITKILIDGKRYKAMTNIGTHPTINELEKPSIETYILDFDENIYNKYVRVCFYKRLRDEVKFDSLIKLQNTLKENEEEVRKFFN